MCDFCRPPDRDKVEELERTYKKEVNLEKAFFVVTVKRGNKTKYGYGELLRDAIAASGTRPGEEFKYAKYVRKDVRQARFLRAAQVGDYYVEE